MANQSIVTKVKNGKIALPRELSKEWQGREVLIVPSYDSVYVKRLSPPSLAELRPKLKKLGKLVTQQDIDEAIKWARRKVYKSRS